VEIDPYPDEYFRFNLVLLIPVLLCLTPEAGVREVFRAETGLSVRFSIARRYESEVCWDLGLISIH